MELAVPLAHPPRLAVIGRGRHEPGTADYLLPWHWCLHAYRWRGSVAVAGRELAIVPGSLHLAPPDHHLHYRYGPDVSHITVHFALEELGGRWPVEEMQAGRADYPVLERELELALTALRSNPVRAQALVWSVLWQLVAPGAQASGSAVDPRFEAACALIDLHLGEELGVATIAAEVGLSHNQLTRIFRREAGTTVVGWIRARRVERARHLLRHTTQPIAAIGASVGLGDPQTFNKTFRREEGRSPRAYRRAGPDHIRRPSAAEVGSGK